MSRASRASRPRRASRGSQGSTLDERIARDCERSGVPFFVEDDALLEKVADWLVPTVLAMAAEGQADREGADRARPA